MKEGDSSKNWIYCVIIFIVAAIVRFIPEFKGGTWPIGYDTFNAYVPDLIKFDGNFLRWLFSANLLYFLVWPFYKIGISANILMKITGSVLYGTLSVSFFIFCQKYLSWKIIKAILATIILIFSLAALRISWDLFRNMLALIFLFPAFYFLNNNGRLRNLLMVGLFSFLVVLSNQLVAAMWFIVLGVFLLKRFSDKEYKKALEVIMISLPVILMFILIMNSPGANTFSGHVYYEQDSTRVLGYFDVYKNKIQYKDLAGIIWAMFWLCFQTILLPVIVGFWLLRKNLILSTMTIWLLVGTFSSLLFMGFGLFVWDRWLLMLIFPFAIYTVTALFGIGEWIVSFKIFNSNGAFTFLKILAVIFWLGFLGFYINKSYPFLVTEYDNTRAPFSNINLNSYFPPTMVHNAVGYEHIQSVIGAIQYLELKAPANSTILVDNRYRGLVLSLFNMKERYVYSYPWSQEINQKAIDELRQKNLGPIYTIWSSQKDIAGFKLVFYSRLIGVFRDQQTYLPYQDN